MTDLFFEIEGNPLPPNALAARLRMRDGVHLRYATFRATGRPHKGTVILLQGRNECIEKYFETVRDLQARGFGVLTFDLRGQGGSDRLISDPNRGYVDRFEDYADDLSEIFENVALPDCRAPFFILGHSTGALIALLAAPALVNRVRRMVLVAPLLHFHSWRHSNSLLRRLTGLMVTFGLGHMYLGGGPRPREAAPFTGNVLTSDEERYRRNQALYAANPELAMGGPTAAWLNAALRAVTIVEDRDFLARIHTPTLIVAAGADRVVTNIPIERLSGRLRSGALVTIDGARHEILQEQARYREQLMAAIDAFMPGSDPQPY